ncbi:MAG: tautomerase family protein [Myxococcales bacterium]|nr:tautomerase family protein [Myxococcales bacterium]MCB9648215.1 tautomerase family protein [Deltaproteobacteria bacterium]
MPHLIVKMYSGRSEDEKRALTAALTRAVTATLGYPEASVSIELEDVEPSRWVDDVYRPDVLARMDRLSKKPGYDPLK